MPFLQRGGSMLSNGKGKKKTGLFVVGGQKTIPDRPGPSPAAAPSAVLSGCASCKSRPHRGHFPAELLALVGLMGLAWGLIFFLLIEEKKREGGDTEKKMKKKEGKKEENKRRKKKKKKRRKKEKKEKRRNKKKEGKKEKREGKK